jgi:hypothetical protein
MSGDRVRLLDAELVARGLSNYDAVSPPLRDNLQLPCWDASCDIAFLYILDWNAIAVQATAARAPLSPVVQPFPALGISSVGKGAQPIRP